MNACGIAHDHHVIDSPGTGGHGPVALAEQEDVMHDTGITGCVS